MTFLNLYQWNWKYPGFCESTLYFSMRILFAHIVLRASLSVNGLINDHLLTISEVCNILRIWVPMCNKFSRLMESKKLFWTDFNRLSLFQIWNYTWNQSHKLKLTCSFLPSLAQPNLTRKPNYYQGKTIPIVNKCKLRVEFQDISFSLRLLERDFYTISCLQEHILF